MVTVGPTEPARLPPSDLVGLDPSWSRLVTVVDRAGIERTFHVLDRNPGDARLTLLCVHGNPSWSYLWRELVAAAPADARVVALDHLDMGFSERTGTARRLADRVDDLSRLTEALNVTGPVVTVAHDWGGPISLAWAQRHVESLVGIVLLNTAVHQPAGAPAPRVIRTVRSRRLLDRVTVDTAAFIQGALEMSTPRPTPEVRRGFLAPYGSPARRWAVGEFVRDIPLEADHPTSTALDQIAAGLDAFADTPTLMLWGAQDKVFSDLYLHDLEDRLPHASVHRYPAAGHFVSEDVDTTAAIVDWLTTIDETVDKSTGSARPSTLTDALRRSELAANMAVSEMSGDRPAITFGELDAIVDETASGLAASGVAAGDRVALMIPPGIDLAVSLYACWRLGAVAVLVDSGLGPKRMSAAVRAANPDLLIGIPKALAAARALRWPGRRISATSLSSVQRHALGAHDDLPTIRGRASSPPPVPVSDALAAIVFTSGSTGPSKGVRYTHAQLEAQRDALASLYEIGPDDRLVAAFAPFALFGPALGISSVVPDVDVAAPRTLTATALGDAVVASDATLVFASPASWVNVVRTQNDLTGDHHAAFDRVRLLLSAGAPVRTSVLSAARSLFPNARAHTPYGMTECLPVASIELDDIEAATGGDGVCVGSPAPGVDVMIDPLDAIGLPGGSPIADAGQVGEVLVRAAHARAGYDRLWHTTHRASLPVGWHRTGDVGQLDGAGRLWIGGRLAHVIGTASGPVTPVAIEQRVESLDDVHSAAAVGVGPTGTQQVVVVLATDDAPKRGRQASIERIDAVRAAVGDIDVAAVLETAALPVDRRHNSKIDRTAIAEWATHALAGRRIRSL
ncbi:MAG: alpha/beta fold hydrolase [Acidimicrobiales bacterium]